jgi:hypothetical protein
MLFIGIRWPSSFGDTSAAGNFLTNFMFRVVHALFLVVCLWVVFDAPFSARIIMDRLLHDVPEGPVGMPFLGFHYLCALAIGYLIGYFLLLAPNPRNEPATDHPFRPPLLPVGIGHWYPPHWCFPRSWFIAAYPRFLPTMEPFCANTPSPTAKLCPRNPPC